VAARVFELLRRGAGLPDIVIAAKVENEPAFYNQYYLLLVVPVGEDDELYQRQLRIRWTCVQSDRLEEYLEPADPDAASIDAFPDPQTIVNTGPASV
jgi:hypothetical protein